MSEPEWLTRQDVIALHERLLAEHGGAAAIRDENLLNSALARPQNLAAYGDPDLFDMAAATMAGIIRNHPFVDGNKRTGFMAGYVFLGVNGHRLTAPQPEVVRIIVALAAGELEEAELAAWLRGNTAPR